MSLYSRIVKISNEDVDKRIERVSEKFREPNGVGITTKSPSSGSSSKSKDVEEPALRKGHEVSRGAERKEQHPTYSKAKFDRNEYQRLYMRDKATIKRLGLNCTVSEFRKQKESEK